MSSQPGSPRRRYPCEGRMKLTESIDVLAVSPRLSSAYTSLPPNGPQQRIDERRRIAERMADSHGQRTPFAFNSCRRRRGSHVSGKFRDADLFEP